MIEIQCLVHNKYGCFYLKLRNKNRKTWICPFETIESIFFSFFFLLNEDQKGIKSL